MNSFLLTLSLVGILSLTDTDATRTPSLKTIDQAVRECGILWNVSPDFFEDFVRTGSGNSTELKELVRCASIWCRWCNVSAHDVVYEVLQNYFNPSPNDQCFLNRTERCMKAALKDLPYTAVLERAFVSFLCYFNQYGNLNRSVQYIPSMPPQEQQVALDTLRIHSVPRETLKDFNEGVFQEGTFECLLRTLLVRLNLYSDTEGPNVKRLYNQDGNEGYLTPETAECVVEARKSCLGDRCELAQITVKNCLPQVYDETVNLIKNAAKMLLQQI
ncbi:general odorant-binding protein 45 [Aedes albopictus]|uniref:Uncharacterized protein n=1 Tax=Aedes albopictus TaxID=7160 RepID=A0ABM1ZHF2_AEDAL|nr:general odorant-binding protein 45 [Aedes albopictus]